MAMRCIGVCPNLPTEIVKRARAAPFMVAGQSVAKCLGRQVHKISALQSPISRPLFSILRPSIGGIVVCQTLLTLHELRS
jgi:hypothetical protein